MSFAWVTLSTGLAAPSPLPADVMRSVVSVEVNESDKAPSGFQIQFRAERSATLTADLPLLASGALAPFRRVWISVTVSGQTSWLMDGVITHVQLVPGPEGATLPVTGEDVSYYMDLVALSVPFPALPDVAIVLAALAGYAFIGIIPDLDPTIGSYVPDPLVEVRQNETHRALVQRLAERNGALFFVEPTGPGTNRAYWGASPRVGVPQPVLSINLGPETNVRSLSFAADLSSPTFVDRVVQGNFGEDIEVTGSGELDVWRYQAVLRPRRLVNVRGAGSTFDGLWYVKSVKHTIRAASYLQAFQLERGGLGTTISSV